MKYFTKTAELTDTQKLMIILGGAGVGAVGLPAMRKSLVNQYKNLPRMIPKTNPEVSGNLDFAADTLTGGVGGAGIGYLLSKLLGD